MVVSNISDNKFRNVNLLLPDWSFVDYGTLKAKVFQEDA